MIDIENPRAETLDGNSNGGKCHLTTYSYMNTSQRYATGHNNAQNSRGAAKSSQFVPLTPDEWTESFLADVNDDYGQRESLFELLNDVRCLCETVDPTPALCSLLVDLLTREAPNIDPHKYDVSVLVRLIGNINRLNASYYSFDMETDYAEKRNEVAKGKGVRNA